MDQSYLVFNNKDRLNHLLFLRQYLMLLANIIHPSLHLSPNPLIHLQGKVGMFFKVET